MDLINGPAGGNVAARMMGTKVRIAGRTMYLPTPDDPILIQDMTLKQIAAIPKDRFFVSVVEVSMPSAMSRTGGKKERYLPQKLRQLQRHHIGARDEIIGLVSKTPPDMSQIETEGTKTFKTLTMLAGMSAEAMNRLESLFFAAMRNQIDAEPDCGIFYEPIDENQLSECIRVIIKDFFGVGDTCKIVNKEYKLPAFCVLMHFYFIRIGILENKARQPFYLYLLKKVFGNEERFTAKTFNNYANEYKYAEEAFTNVTQLSIDFSRHPTPSGKLLDAFQEIGHVFQKSPYFDELRELRKCMDNWKI